MIFMMKKTLLQRRQELVTGWRRSPIRESARARRAAARKARSEGGSPQHGSDSDDVHAGLRDKGSPASPAALRGPRTPTASPRRSVSPPRKQAARQQWEAQAVRLPEIPMSSLPSSPFSRRSRASEQKSVRSRSPLTFHGFGRLSGVSSFGMGGTRTATSVKHSEVISDAVVMRPKPFVKASNVPSVILPPSSIASLGGVSQERSIKLRSGTITIGPQSVQFDLERIHKDDRGTIMALIKTHFKRGGRVGKQRHSAAQLIKLVLKAPGSTKIIR